MRGKQSKIRKIQTDAVYNSILIAKFINNVMQQGKKSIAESIVYQAMKLLEKDLKKKSLEIFEKAVENVKPRLEVRPRRVGGVNYQVPVPVSEHRQLSLALKWMVVGARARRKKEKFYVALAEEVKEAYKKTGFAMKKKDEMQRMAEANKAFAHFQW